MKSSAYEMHNYAAALTPAITDSVEIKSTRSTRSRNEKYSLRQRQKRKASTQNKQKQQQQQQQQQHTEAHEYTSDNNSNNDFDTYFENDGMSDKQQQTSKTKTKAAPLSKYRRKTANARERTRMREINSAFENLRQCVPNTICGEDAGVTNEKLTKITTLRLAMKYITILKEALNNPTFEADLLLQCIADGDFRFTTTPTMANDMPTAALATSMTAKIPQLSNKEQTTKTNQLTPVNAVNKSKAVKNSQNAPKTHKTARKTPAKRTGTKFKHKQQQQKQHNHQQQQQQKQKQQQRHAIITTLTADYCESLLSPTSSLCSTSSSTASRTSTQSTSSAYASLSTNSSPAPIVIAYNNQQTRANQQSVEFLLHHTPTIKTSSLTDLSSLLLESDGDSLHLSETCFSPLEHNNNNSNNINININKNSNNYAHHLLDEPLEKCISDNEFTTTIATFDNPLEINLRLLESTTEALDFNIDNQQQPSACISPLVTLDGFSPFGDLLHGDFTEPSSLDLFLT